MGDTLGQPVGMPWKVSSPVSERLTFITRLQKGERMAELCREFGISRKTGYKLVERYGRLGDEGLFDESRRPHRLARSKSVALRELFIQGRKEHPDWGPKKLRAVMLSEHPDMLVPSASAIGDWLKSAGLVSPRGRKPRVTPYVDLLSKGVQPNDVWCVDYKGQFRLGNGTYCYPLTMTDQFSRYLLACEGFEGIDGNQARSVFENVFAAVGLPNVIRSDNGSPFASRGLFGLSRLSAWWLKLGIKHERIEPGHPEQNGRHERMHRTLKAETTRPAGATLLQQQERFDAFVEEFNTKRPHEALEQKPPAHFYRPSSRTLASVPPLTYPLHDDVVQVSAKGNAHLMRRRGGNVFLTSALAGELVGVREELDGSLLISYANLDLGTLDVTTAKFHPADELLSTNSQEATT